MGKRPKIKDNSAAAAAAAAAAQAAANNLQANFATDLKDSSMGQVIAGGTAAESDALSTLRKKKPAGSLSSQLGIQV